MIEEHEQGEQGVKNLLKAHFISDQAFNALLDNEYKVFCEARKAEIQQRDF